MWFVLIFISATFSALTMITTKLGVTTSAVTTLTFYAGLKLQYTSIVMPVDKLLSAVMTLVMAYFAFGETVNRRAAFALCLIGVGTVLVML